MTNSTIEQEEHEVSDVADEVSDEGVADPLDGTDDAPRPRRIARLRRVPGRAVRRIEGWSRRRKTLTLVPLAVWVLALIAAVSVLGVRIHDNAAVADARSGALAAADAGVPKLLSYQADSVDRDLGSASGLLTGDFKNRFQSLVRDTIVPAAKQQQTVTKASVVGKSVVKASVDAVTVLMFIDQSTTGKDTPQPRLDASRVRIQLDRVGGQWLISGLQPV
ncbi:hypothetical protein [Nocardia nova]|uniref:Mce-associated membrane protein n=1 Tax=Nocardia nova TaxID=37330 RepID=A0A2S6A224_9NOCA|nr:hypothetical protein [Nocardia nova]PPJ25555.1 hypothetical protein C5F51_22190 [Nocardia nova]